MAKARRNLSPKRAMERMQRHRHAVMVLALMRAKKAVQTQICAKGQRISDYSTKEINHLAHDYLAQHGERLRAEAEHTTATWPGFARWRLPDFANLASDAQKENAPKSTTSAVHMLGAQ